MRNIIDMPYRPWAFFGLGSQSRDRNPFGFGWGLNHSWDVFLDDYLKVAYEYGFREVVLHRPAGESDIGDVMDFDSNVDIQEDHPDVEQVQPKAVRHFLERVRNELPGMSLIPYFGSLKDSDFKDLESAGDAPGWVSRAMRSLDPWIDPEFDFVHLAFDTGGTYSGVNLAFTRMIRGLLKAQGRELFLEPCLRGREDLFDIPSICAENYWWRIYTWGTDNDNPSGWHPGVVRIWNGHAIGRNAFDDNVFEWMSDCIQFGHIPCVAFSHRDTFKQTWGRDYRTMIRNQRAVANNRPDLVDLDLVSGR